MDSRHLILAILLSFSSLQYVAGQDTIGCFEPGECQDSMFVGVTTLDSPGECLQYCSATEGCEFFTHYSTDSICFAFVNCVVFSEETCFDCISGDVECADVSCDLAGRCDGTLVDFFTVDDKEHCIELCVEDEACAWWTYDSDIGICTLTSDCPILDSSCTTCLAGERFCGGAPPDGDEDRLTLLTVGGHNSVEYFMAETEAIDLSGNQLSCPSTPDYPYEIQEVGLFYDGETPTACGGYGYDTQGTIFADCYSLSGGSWSNVATMSRPRRGHTVSPLDPTRSRFLIVGGYDGLERSPTTEIYEAGSLSEGPMLPFGLSRHCATPINRTHIAFVGGESNSGEVSSPERQFLLYDITSETFTEMSTMSVERTGFGCGAIFSGVRGLELIVAGGVKDEAAETSEIYSFVTDSWRTGPALPVGMRYMASTPFQDTFLLAGGYDSEGTAYLANILSYDYANEMWQNRTETLGVASNNLAGIMVSEAAIQCQ